MGFWEIVGIIYLGTVGLSASSYYLFRSAYKAKRKRLGYVLKEKASRIEKIVDFITRLFSLMLVWAFPILNLYTVYMLFNFDKFFEEFLNTNLKEGHLVKVETLEKEKLEQEEYLAKRIAEVKEYQSKLGYKKQVHALSEYSTDEKIAMLLRELELLYEEKAREEGIEVTENKDLSQEKTVMKILEPQKETKPKK